MTVIYFIQDEGSLLIKIGFTDGEAAARLKALQTGCPSGLILLATMEGDKAMEGSLHDRFACARERGEWFRPIPDLLQFILGAARWEGRLDEQTATPWGKWPLIIYLAGKIHSGDWRTSIVEEPTCELTYEEPWPVRPRAVFGLHSYSGPYFSSFGHGCDHGDDSHGVSSSLLSDRSFNCHKGSRAEEVVSSCHLAIRRSDLIFAWIDQGDCYGTIAELGAAHALGKRIWIAGPRRFRDMWFVYEYAERTSFFHAHTPQQILNIWLNDEGKASPSVFSNGVA